MNHDMKYRKIDCYRAMQACGFVDSFDKWAVLMLAIAVDKV